MAIERALLALLALAGAILLFLGENVAPVFLSEPGDLGAWRKMVSLTSNAYFSWRVDPVIAAVSSSSTTALTLQLLVFVAGASLLLQAWRHDDGWSRAVPGAICMALLLLYLFGADTPLFGALAWLPLFIYAQARIVESAANRSMLLWVLLLFVSVRIVKGANFLAPLVLLGAVAITTAILPKDDEERAISRSRLLAAQLVLALVPYLLFLLDLPRPDWFDYPDSATLAPHDGTLGVLRPHTGWAPPLPVIDRPAVKALHLWPSAIAFGLALLVLCYNRSASRAPLLTLALAGCVLLDSVLPEPLTEIAPVSVISRMFPGMLLLPLSTIFLAMAFVSLLLSAYGSERRAAFALVVLVLAAMPGPGRSYARWGRLVPAVDPALLERTDPALFTPSLYTIRTRGLAVLDERRRFEIPGFGAVEPADPSVRVSDHPEWVKNMSDRDPSTRWSASNGGQHGKEWLHLRFSEPERISGMKLGTGEYASDFPMTLRIRYARECAADEKLSRDDFTSYELSTELSWQGPVRYTPNGLPYLGEQSDVRMVLPEVIEAQCIAIEQLGQGHFDWSVAELRIAVEKAAGLADAL